ncbi:hypothetical protein Ssed_2193 [Shewanella sediminis HAW-EB3]|uniref:Uncharacterized protein n=1 Tax=Shewanella sediminis (strain HAW-EB3) TaxID=425104 RepID=A8FVC9_SHESH|nr:hypothetical protein [Shewanella sediminis]ABV36802.1 hypothetical protein Ssed_2193 [Shewanella sediminis HAW-EB3]
MMGNHKSKKTRALEHNRIYAINRGETVATDEPKQAVNVGSVGLVHDGKSFVSTAIEKTKSKPKRFDGSLYHLSLVYLSFYLFYWGTTWLIQY